MTDLSTRFIYVFAAAPAHSFSPIAAGPWGAGCSIICTILNDLVTQFCLPGSLLIGISGSAHSVLRHQGGRNTSTAAAHLGCSCEAPPTSARTHGGWRGFTPTGVRPGSVGCWWSLAWLAALMLVPADGGDVNGGVLLLRGAASHWPTGLRPCSAGCWSLARHVALMLVPADGGDDNGGVLSPCEARTHRPTGLRPGSVGCWSSHRGTWL